VNSGLPAVADAEIAAAVFADHVARVGASAQARDYGWVFTWLDPLHVVVPVTAVRRSGEQDGFYVKLGGAYYDEHPPTTSFVCPPRAAIGDRPARDGWVEAPASSRWLPVVNGLEWLAIHADYPHFADGISRQLVCCSMTFEYYITNHTPTAAQRWQQGRHTLGATLNRIQDALTCPHYEGPAGAADP
jgi:hypothetical protein